MTDLATDPRAAAVDDVLATHRRHRNVRSCTGCDWRPEHPGSTTDPDDTRRRHAAFNAHLRDEVLAVLDTTTGDDRG